MINKVIALDWRAMKYYHIRGLVLPLAAFLAGVIYSPMMVIPFFAFLGMSFSMNPFAVEEKGELNHLYLTLPIKRNQIVIGRYALSVIILLASMLLGIPLTALSNTISFSKCLIGFDVILIISAISFFIYAVSTLFMFPVLFKLGYQKGKMWGFYIPIFLLSFIIAGFSMITLLHGANTFPNDFIAFIINNPLLFSGGLLLLAIALLALSCLISIKIYLKRSF